MPEEPKEERKSKLVRRLQDVEEQAARIEGLGQIIVRTARFSRDAASCLRDAVNAIPNDSYLTPGKWDRLEAPWEAWQGTAHRLTLDVATSVNSFQVSADAAVGTSTGGVYDIMTGNLPSGPRGIIEEAGSRLEKVVSSIPLVSEVKASMVRLGLDRRGGAYRTAVERLEQAEAAIACPSAEDSGEVGVLIAIRESIDAAMSGLLARRPEQEPAKKSSAKVVSIGRQCCRAALSPDHFIRLGAEIEMILDALSGAKQQKLSRPQVIERYNQALLLLRAFLNSLDETRFRP